MIDDLRVWLIRLQQRAVGLSTLLLLCINVLLVGSLLYIVLPQYDRTINSAEILRRVELVTKNMNVDVVSVWQVSLVQNRRTYLGSYVSHQADRPIVAEYTNIERNQNFTGALQPDVAFALMNGNTLCLDVSSNHVKAINPATQRFREAIGAKHVCWVPILSRQGHMIGYVSFIWKDPIAPEDIASFISRSIGLVNQ